MVWRGVRPDPIMRVLARLADARQTLSYVAQSLDLDTTWLFLDLAFLP